MKSVLISIHPKWCNRIIDGDKTIEVRKTRPKIETPFKCYIYMTSGGYEYRDPWCTAVMPPNGGKLYNGPQRIIGEFICDSIKEFGFTPYNHGEYVGIDDLADKSCLSFEDLYEYIGDGYGYGWHISDLKTYDMPKELNEFYRWYDGITDIRPCQNGRGCDHAFYDYGEDCEACRVDYDGTDCPFLRVQRPPQSWCYVEEIT